MLIIGSYLNEILSDVMRASCVSYAMAEKLLEFRQPAGDCSSRIILYTSLGLIHDEEMAGLTALRKIRNKAANHAASKSRNDEGSGA